MPLRVGWTWMHRLFVAGPRRLLWLVLGSCALVFVSTATAYGLPPAAKARPRVSTPVLTSVTGVHPLTPHPMPKPAKQTPYKPVHTTWPAAGSVSLAIGAAKVPGPTHMTAAGVAQPWSQASFAPVHATGAPVWARATTADGPQQVNVRVAPHAAAQALGINGVVLTAASSGDAGTATIGVDYGGFAQAFGGNWTQNLTMVRLPACALTTPELAACWVQTPLPASNDFAGQTVSSTVDLPRAGVAEAIAGLPQAATAQPSLVLAVTPDTSGGSGDGGGDTGTFSATTLKASGSWSEGGDTGSFDYSYPITVPPAASDLAPQVSLGYSSSSVDGENASTQFQSSWVGDGWSTPDAFIEETYTSCSSKPEGAAGNGSSYQDMCYDGRILTMSLGGSTTSLVWDDTSHVWKAQNDNGDVITRLTGTSNGTYDGDYWKVTETDGTVYYFGLNRLPGWATGDATTNSVDTEPVYSAHAPSSGGMPYSDPCYSSSGFTASVCTMAYRWNLDYVIDLHHNAMAYFYTTTTNYYAKLGNTGVNGTAYTADSHLSKIVYGFVDPNFYTSTPPDEVVFGTGDRCVSGTCDPLNSTNAPNWPDVDYTDICAPSTHCTVSSPTFYSLVRLTTITTEQYNGTSYLPIDVWTLTQTMPKPSDMTSATLWLNSIVHEGLDTSASGGGSPITLPAVTFSGVQLSNRVDSTTDGLGPLERYRIHTITGENGSVTTVTYGQPNPCTPPVTLTPATNTSSCYPVYWTPPGQGSPFLDWFNVWSVTSIAQSDPFSSGTESDYSYLGGAAYRYDDNEVVQAKYRTYGQFRGYAEVQTHAGLSSDGTTLEDQVFYRGMSADNGGPTVTITDSQGGQHTDLDQLAGEVEEDTGYTADTAGSDGGVVDHSTINSYWVSAPTAMHTRSAYGLPDLTANIVRPVESLTRQRVTSGGTVTWRYTEDDSTYNDTGLITAQYKHTVPSDSRYDQCSTTVYAPANTSENLVGLPAEQEADQLACGGFTEGSIASIPGSINTLTAPAVVSRPADVISATRTFYDNPTMATIWPQPANPAWPQATPTKGEVSVVQQSTDQDGYTWRTKTTSLYDSYGRITETFDAAGKASTTAYNMTNGVLTATTLTDPLGHQTTETFNPYRSLVTSVKDPNNITTTARYDALGRIIAVWDDSRATTAPANSRYVYTVGTTTTPTVVETESLNDSSGYIISYSIEDGLYRTIETQTPTPVGGRDITETFYDSHSWMIQKDAAYYDDSALPGPSLVTAEDANVPNYDVIGYDGLGRAVADTSYDRGAAQYTSGSVYTGDTTTMVPPAGGTATATKTNILGQTIEIDDYTTPPVLTVSKTNGYTTTSMSGGTSQAITYGYDRRGNQTTITAGAPEPGNQIWTATYNILGQVIAKADPDGGASSMTYDAMGNLQTATSYSPNIAPVPAGQTVGAQGIPRVLAHVIPQGGASCGLSTCSVGWLSSRCGRVSCWAGSWVRS